MTRQIKNLTPRQQEVLGWIKDFIGNHSMPPTVREIGRAFNMKSSSVFDHLKALERKGCLKRGDLGARHLILLEQAVTKRFHDFKPRADSTAGSIDEKEIDNLIEIPILGKIAAGAPILAVENVIGRIKVEDTVVRSGRHFALEVSGDSMTGAGINEGNFVIVRQQPVAESGDIVVALLEDEATVKRLYVRDARIELRPENPKHRPIPIGPDDDLRILGKVVAIRHSKD